MISTPQSQPASSSPRAADDFSTIWSRVSGSLAFLHSEISPFLRRSFVCCSWPHLNNFAVPTATLHRLEVYEVNNKWIRITAG